MNGVTNQRSGETTSIGLGEMTWTEIAGLDEPPLLLVPVGSLEQHGPHLPLDTDTRIAVAIAQAADAALSGAIVTPPLLITASGEHQGFAGTLSIGTPATTAVIVELVRSADWAGGVVLVNGHGGNIDAIAAAVTTLEREQRRVLPWWPRVRDGDAHAGRTETALMLAIAQHVVRVDRAEAGNTSELEELAPRLRDGGVAAVSPTGVLGDPTPATAAEGKRLLDELATDLVASVERWRSQ